MQKASLVLPEQSLSAGHLHLPSHSLFGFGNSGDFLEIRSMLILQAQLQI